MKIPILISLFFLNLFGLSHLSSFQVAEPELQKINSIPRVRDILQFSLQAVKRDGFYLELGVWTGNTINRIASFKPDQIIYGFDSFKGLPEEWTRDGSWPAGTFSLDAKTHFFVRPNVSLIPGWFEDTLPVFAKSRHANDSIAFMHVDCDLYSSTACAFQHLGSFIKNDTIIVFDELIGYENYENHELKALNEFLDSTGFSAEWLAWDGERVAIRIRSDMK